MCTNEEIRDALKRAWDNEENNPDTWDQFEDDQLNHHFHQLSSSGQDRLLRIAKGFLSRLPTPDGDRGELMEKYTNEELDFTEWVPYAPFGLARCIGWRVRVSFPEGTKVEGSITSVDPNSFEVSERFEFHRSEPVTVETLREYFVPDGETTPHLVESGDVWFFDPESQHYRNRFGEERDPRTFIGWTAIDLGDYENL